MVREPLLVPLLAFGTGILVAEYVAFQRLELAAAGVVLARLGGVSHYRGSRWLAMLCTGLAMAGAGGLCRQFHAPGPAPQLDAGNGEVLILSGCVVEPPVFSVDREQF